MVLQIRDIHKQYKTGDFVQKALDGVTLNLRDSEFVAILIGQDHAAEHHRRPGPL